MPRKLFLLTTLITIFLISAGILQGQELPDAFDAALRDIRTNTGRTYTREQLLDYAYSEVYDDFNQDCDILTGTQERYTIVTVTTDLLIRYIYHVKADGVTAKLCKVQYVQPTATPTIDLTHMTVTPTLVPTVTETPRPGAARCPGFMYSRLRVGEQGRVLPGEPNRLREQPIPYGMPLRVIPPGQVFDVLDGPECNAAGAWWRVRYLQTEGWTVEGDGRNYFVEPVVVVSGIFPTNTLPPTLPPPMTARPTSCYASPSPRLVVYGWGRVTPGEPNNMRKRPSTLSYIVGIIPAGETFRVNYGPECDNSGHTWWRVLYNGIEGWTIEGEGDTYYVEPINEPAD